MGLFGLFCSALTGGVFIADTMRNTSLDSKWKQDAIRNDHVTRIDSHGKEYLVSTGERVFSDSYGNLKSVKTGKVVYSYQQESANRYNREAIAKAKAEGKKYASLIYPEFNRRDYHTELSTMKRYYLRTDALSYYREPKKFYKIYYAENLKYISPTDVNVEITKEEFELLGGIPSCPKLYAYET